jgi:hypothetical protein
VLWLTPKTTSRFSHRIHRLAAIISFLLLLVRLAHTKALAKGDLAKLSLSVPGADIFSTNASVLRIRIELAALDLESLRREPRKFVPAIVREGSLLFTNVAIHLKGAAGSFRQVDDKPALTLSFGKLTSDQRFHGLRKIHLNNSVQDPSFSTEDICGGMFHAAGVPAPRVANARVWLNGRDLGFYVLVEGFNRDFLGRYFKHTEGNLYDGGFLKDVTDTLEKESGNDNKDESDLKALASASREPDLVKRWQRLNKTLDVNRFISFIAMEVLVWDWDGYPMNRNNYRIYHDPANGKLVFIPHGMDQMFWEAGGPIHPNFGGLVASAIVQTPEGSRLYRQRLGELFQDVYRLDVLTNHVGQLYARNRPAVAETGPDAVKDYDNAVEQVRDRIVQRWIGVSNQLKAEPTPLKFSNGIAKLSGWREQNDPATATLDRPGNGGKTTLHIAAAGHCTASWRAKVLLEGGRYRFEGLARCARLAPTNDGPKGEGAGLRISGTTLPRANKLAGDSPWQRLEFEFDVAPPLNSVELVCELRATAGEVWFDAGSLRLVRLK